MYRKVLTILCMCCYGHLVKGQQFSNKVLMVLTTNTSIDMIDVWNITGGINHSQGKESLPLQTLISGGTYRSPTVDKWCIDPPTQVTLEVTNEDGTVLWWTLFDTYSTNSSLYSWMTMANVIDSSADFTDPIYNPGFKFRQDEFCDFEIEQASRCWLCFHRISHLSGLHYASEFIITSTQKSLPKDELGNQALIGEILFFEKFNYIKGNRTYILHDNDIGIGIEELSGCAYSSIQQNYLSHTFTIKHSLERCSTNSAVYVQESSQPKLFNTLSGCLSYVPLPTLVVRCLEATVDNAEAGVTFTFKARGSRSFVKGEAAVITGFWLEENTTSSLPHCTEDNSVTTSGIGTSAETTVHHISTQSDTSVNLSMTPTIMPMVTHPVQTSSGLDTTSSTVKKSNFNVTLSQGTTTETGTSLSQITDTSQLMTSVTISSNQTAISNLAYTTQKTIDPKSPTTDIMSGTRTSQTDVEEIVSVGACVCKCKGTGNYITEAELALKIHLQKTKITLQKTNLTAYIRKLTSATDSRTSAQGLGYLGALVIAIVVCILILFDVLNCLQSKSSISRTK